MSDNSAAEAYTDLLALIASKHLGMELQESGGHTLYSVSVDQVRAALDAAFKAGVEVGLSSKAR